MTQAPTIDPRKKRRFAITASDPYLSVLLSFVQAGWEPVALYCVADGGLTANSRWTIQRAQQLGMEIHLSRIDDAALQHLANRNCDLLVVASYDWKIGPWQQHLPHAVNFHPSLLPEYRGAYPQVHGIVRGERRWGVTCHKLAATFDSGDILAQRDFALDADETLERMNLRIQMAVKTLSQDVASNFDKLWAQATPQQGGSYFGKFTDADRTLDFNQSVDHLGARYRAFGSIECLAVVRGVRMRVLQATFWKEQHAHAPGTIVSALDGQMIITVLDGYIGITRWLVAVPDINIGGMA